MEIDVSDTESAELIEGLKKAPAKDAPTDGESGDESGPQDAPDDATEDAPDDATEHVSGEQETHADAPGLGIDPQEFDEAVGKLWVVGAGILAKQLEEPELREEQEMAHEAADALGPVARKHIPKHLQKHGVEAVALAWISGRVFSKWQAIDA